MNEETQELWLDMISRSLRNFLPPEFPTIVCLCGSTRFGDTFREENFKQTLAGKIVLTVGCDLRSDHELWPDEATREKYKKELDQLHLRKIDISDIVMILNVGGYIGSSTRNELNYALKRGKKITFLEPVAGEKL